MTEAVFGIGEPVAKVGGDYRFDGWIVGHVWKRSGELRYAVEDDRGVLHIFNERQICRRQEIDAMLKGGDRHNPSGLPQHKAVDTTTNLKGGDRHTPGEGQPAPDIATPAARLAPAAGRPFKIGDRVRVRVVRSGYEIATVHAIDYDDGALQLRFERDGTLFFHWFLPEHVEHLDPAQPAQDAVPAAGEAERLAAGLLRLEEWLIGKDIDLQTDDDMPSPHLAATLLTRQAELIRTLMDAAHDVCWFDWSTIDDDAQDSIDDLRAALDAATAPFVAERERLLARVERAEKALRRVAPFLDCIIDYTSGLEYEGNAAAHEVNQALAALTGDTPNV